MATFFSGLVSHPVVHRVGKKVFHKAHEAAHATYLALVYKEAHGYYGKAAGVLLLVVVAGWVIGMFGGDEDHDADDE